MDKKIEVLSTTRIKYSSDLYKIVDSLNRTLKEQDLMFGLALDEKDNKRKEKPKRGKNCRNYKRKSKACKSKICGLL